MTRLLVYPEYQSVWPLFYAEDFDTIKLYLKQSGVYFTRWQSRLLPPNVSAEIVLDAYQAEISQMTWERGFLAVDVVRMAPPTDGSADSPAWAKQVEHARNKFLQEHTHDDDEVRFFAEGSGLFYLHLDGRVVLVLCETGDVIAVPKNTKHWFDMGTCPYFCAVRFFTKTEGWVAEFTGSDLAAKLPSFDVVRSSHP